MSRKRRSQFLLEKSIQAVISAIEVYNKPDFKYREESFSILIVNAWETLLKSKIVSDNNNNLKSIYVEDKSLKKKNGESYKVPKYKTNRSGNYLTIDIYSCLKKIKVDKRLEENIELLVEIRDNAIHFFNESKLIEKKVLEIGTASLKSYVTCVNNWFHYDLSKFNFYLMPISFFHPYEIESYSINEEDKQHQNLLNFITEKESKYPSDTKEEHNISLILKTKFIKSSSIGSVRLKSDSSAPFTVSHSSEEQFINHYPWNWNDELLPRLKNRYKNFKMNNDFWIFKKELEKETKLCGVRSLDWNKPNGTKKKFYNPNILKEFDKRYTLK